MDNEKFELGQVKISDDVVIIIAGIAASQVKGVNTARTGVTDGITNLFSKNNYAKGIKVEVTEETVVVDIFINVEYGYRINEVAKEVQLAIKKEIETMTDLQVAAVNVHVLNIVDKEKDKDKIKDKEPVDIALE
ncbi:MAG TPA: Asp23/Gls24 family envelope stress response protein [Sedimentibacter sp.]|nr:Asp23/Gls24 family envelope stress response protein [Sedimentibacter sp.]HNZ82238.1 Asp23/Gls24 family envelope stress response protein [Sedimentibacter sp.]HOH69035.1 Asp23/Gls24 family envelope stress response protein [Sedimentibacter sp.]HQB63365.1 Asp23/Gls24 family envelope stress response protein [Sedimentibacter sp.]